MRSAPVPYAQSAIHSLEEPKNFEFLQDVPVIVSAEVARTTMTLRDILGLRKGSTIAFDKLLGEPIDMVVVDRRSSQDTFTARGEIVVLNERYGLRITSVGQPLPKTRIHRDVSIENSE